MRDAIITALAWAATAIAAGIAAPAVAQTGPAPAAAPKDAYRWVTLGTMGGPQPSLSRHEPANALARPGATYIVDAGDGVATQMIGAGLPIVSVRAIFISHLHFDHTGGLFALLGLRNQMKAATPLTIYGPPLTRQLVAGLLAAMKPGSETGFGVAGEPVIAPETNIKVVELQDGERIQIADLAVTAVNNTHYAKDASASRFKSLSFRFDLPDRSIVYTGDTGPSAKLETLAKGADLLVSEMIDLDAALATLRRFQPNMPAEQQRVMAEHLRDHHLTTRQVGELARRAGVGRVVLTHIAAGGAPDAGAALRYEKQVAEISRGPVVVAQDLQSF